MLIYLALFHNAREIFHLNCLRLQIMKWVTLKISMTNAYWQYSKTCSKIYLWKKWSAPRKMYQKFLQYSTTSFMLSKTVFCFYHYCTDGFRGLERYFPLLFAHKSLMTEICVWSNFWPLTISLVIWCLCCQPVQWRSR